MTMHIVFKQDKDGYKKDQSCYVERALARRFCRSGVAIPYQQHLDDIYDAEQVVKKANEKKKADLLKKKANEKKKADSKKVKKQEKAIK